MDTSILKSEEARCIRTSQILESCQSRMEDLEICEAPERLRWLSGLEGLSPGFSTGCSKDLQRF